MSIQTLRNQLTALQNKVSSLATSVAVNDALIAAQPKVYGALLTQTGTDAPAATVLENTLGGAVVWTHVADGVDRCVFPSAIWTIPTIQVGVFVNDALDPPNKMRVIALANIDGLGHTGVQLKTLDVNANETQIGYAGIFITIYVYD